MLQLSDSGLSRHDFCIWKRTGKNRVIPSPKFAEMTEKYGFVRLRNFYAGPTVVSSHNLLKLLMPVFSESAVPIE